MGTRIMHSYETKMNAIKLKRDGHSEAYILRELGIKNRTQLYTWLRWYRKGELHRFTQPVGKQYSYGKGPEGSTPEETLRLQNKSLQQQIELLKKYVEMEKRWYQR